MSPYATKRNDYRAMFSVGQLLTKLSDGEPPPVNRHPSGHDRSVPDDRSPDVPAETALWATAILFFGLGDTITTVAGIRVSGAVELSPLLSAFREPAVYGALILLKFVVFGACYVLWVVTPRPHCLGAPLGLAGLGIVVTCWNTIVLGIAVS